MELTLNLIWVCVAIAGILAMLAVLSRASACSDRPANTGQKIVAMGCALVILFFVISMTDDLHGQAILFEDKKPSRVFSVTTNSAPSSAAHAVPFVFLLFVSCVSLLVDLPSVRRQSDSPRILIVLSLRGPVDGRAPPLSLA